MQKRVIYFHGYCEVSSCLSIWSVCRMDWYQILRARKILFHLNKMLSETVWEIILVFPWLSLDPLYLKKVEVLFPISIPSLFSGTLFTWSAHCCRSHLISKVMLGIWYTCSCSALFIIRNQPLLAMFPAIPKITKKINILNKYFLRNTPWLAHL